MRYADLSLADLTDVSMDEDALAQVRSLGGAIMPDGTKHE
jgi:hypothetical protein